MPKDIVSVSFLACIPQAIEAHWDTVYAPRLAGFPVNIVYAARAEGHGLRHATYVFDPSTLVENDQSRQMRYRSTVKSDPGRAASRGQNANLQVAQGRVALRTVRAQISAPL